MNARRRHPSPPRGAPPLTTSSAGERGDTDVVGRASDVPTSEATGNGEGWVRERDLPLAPVYATRPSRRQKRRGAEDAMELGKALVELAAVNLEKLELPPDIADAVDDARRFRAHAARKRQMQFLAKLLRQSDDLERLQQACERLGDLDRRSSAQFQRVERWRKRLLEEGDQALSELQLDYPEVDLDKIRKLVSSAQREAAQGLPPTAFRALFRELRSIEMVTETPTHA